MFRGAYARAGSVPSEEDEGGGVLHPRERWRRRQLHRADAYRRIMLSHVFFSGRTAAAICDLPVPPRPTDDIEVACVVPGQAPRVRGVLSARVREHLVSTTTHRGFRVTSPPSTWVMLAADLALPDLVALGDAVIRRPRIAGTSRLERQPFATLEDLHAEIDRGRRPGLVAARRALPLLSPHSASAPESHLRLRLREWGLPDPALDVDVRDASGRLLSCTEIAYPEFRVAFEYEGDHHRVSRAQWDRDIEKAREYTAARWITVRVTARLLYATPERLRGIAEATLRSRDWSGGGS